MPNHGWALGRRVRLQRRKGPAPVQLRRGNVKARVQRRHRSTRLARGHSRRPVGPFRKNASTTSDRDNRIRRRGQFLSLAKLAGRVFEAASLCTDLSVYKTVLPPTVNKEPSRASEAVNKRPPPKHSGGGRNRDCSRTVVIYPLSLYSLSTTPYKALSSPSILRYTPHIVDSRQLLTSLHDATIHREYKRGW